MRYSSKKTKELLDLFEELEAEKKDMQGLIARGYNSLNSAVYILLQITNAAQAKVYFNQLIENYITSADKSGIEDLTKNGDPKKAVHIAFTISGLKNLDLPENVLSTFSRQFKEGMSFNYPDPDDKSKIIKERSSLLGDTRNNDPANWRWGNAETEKVVDCVIMLYAEYNTDLDTLVGAVYTNLEKGVKLVYMGGTFQYDPNISKEHFGFQDGISQPIIKGFSQSRDEPDDDKLINPGEFILGYKNDYNNYSPSPYVDSCTNSDGLACLPGFTDKKDLGKNGTYLVFRQIEQHVEKFWDFHYNKSKEAAASQTEKAVKLAAKMIGRWPEGQPLVTCPNGACPMDDDSLNDFSYSEMDNDGINCPLGAHIRRTNPRDQVHTGRGVKDSIEMAKKHRMLRRGRSYGKPLDQDFNIDNMLWHVRNKTMETNSNVNRDCHPETKEVNKDDKETITIKRGLHFICMVSDIERQFEFVQNVWANTSTFGDLCNEVDPIISPRPTDAQPHCHEFTTPQNIIRNRYKNVPEFTTVVGGAYFFMPGINALKYIMRR